MHLWCSFTGLRRLLSRNGVIAELTADGFTDTLGDLRHADAATQEAVLTYVHELGNTTRTAERLFTHRNTVLRRLARADELLPRPLAENVVGVGAALEAGAGTAPDEAGDEHFPASARALES